jgi:two-component system, cell cycle sensor histidine kinase and response regulator CckA
MLDCNGTRGPQQGGGHVILLVEDDASIRQIFRYGLTQEGFTVLPAKHTHEALKLCKEYPSDIHLLITDLGLPDELRLADSNTAGPTLKGLELIRRALTLRPSIKVMFISGQSEESLQKSGALQTGWPLLRKPFGLDTLLRHVRLVLSNSAS